MFAQARLKSGTGTKNESGDLSELRSGSQTGLTQIPTLDKQSGGQLMAIATERRADVSVTIGGREMTFETGKLAKQADGSVHRSLR